MAAWGHEFYLLVLKVSVLREILTVRSNEIRIPKVLMLCPLYRSQSPTPLIHSWNYAGWRKHDLISRTSYIGTWGKGNIYVVNKRTLLLKFLWSCRLYWMDRREMENWMVILWIMAGYLWQLQYGMHVNVVLLFMMAFAATTDGQGRGKGLLLHNFDPLLTSSATQLVNEKM